MLFSIVVTTGRTDSTRHLSREGKIARACEDARLHGLEVVRVHAIGDREDFVTLIVQGENRQLGRWFFESGKRSNRRNCDGRLLHWRFAAEETLVAAYA